MKITKTDFKEIYREDDSTVLYAHTMKYASYYSLNELKSILDECSQVITELGCKDGTTHISINNDEYMTFYASRPMNEVEASAATLKKRNDDSTERLNLRLELENHLSRIEDIKRELSK